MFLSSGAYGSKWSLLKIIIIYAQSSSECDCFISGCSKIA